jgi:ADP-heptose:LPS heptosyltransferase
MSNPIFRLLVMISEIFRSIYLCTAVRVILSKPLNRAIRDKKKVLLVRLDAIGDFIIWLDAAQALRTLYPPEKYEITLLGNQTWTSLASLLPYFDRVWNLDRLKYLRNPFYCYTILSKVHEEQFDLAINPAFSREFQLGDVLVKVSDADEKIGSQGEREYIRKWQKNISDRWYTRLIPSEKRPLMELERNAEFIRGLGITDFCASVPVFPVLPDVPDSFDLKNYYVIFPGAGAAARQWPLERFKELAERIYDKIGWICVVCGGRGEELFGRGLEEGSKGHLQNWAGRTSLPELVAIIARAKLLVANETSAVHIAAAVSTPAVCILGGGHFGRFLPYRTEVQSAGLLPVPVFKEMECFGCSWDCIFAVPRKQAVPCILGVELEAVWEAIEKMIDNISPEQCHKDPPGERPAGKETSQSL